MGKIYLDWELPEDFEPDMGAETLEKHIQKLLTEQIAVDEFLDRAQIYHDGIKVDGVFFTWEEYDKSRREMEHHRGQSDGDSE